MIKRLSALLLLGALLISLSGCALIWGTEKETTTADWIASKKETFGDGNRHAMTHVEIMFRDFNKMHEFWDRYFMNYDWDDPYID